MAIIPFGQGDRGRGRLSSCSLFRQYPVRSERVYVFRCLVSGEGVSPSLLLLPAGRRERYGEWYPYLSRGDNRHKLMKTGYLRELPELPDLPERQEKL